MLLYAPLWPSEGPYFLTCVPELQMCVLTTRRQSPAHSDGSSSSCRAALGCCRAAAAVLRHGQVPHPGPLCDSAPAGPGPPGLADLQMVHQHTHHIHPARHGWVGIGPQNQTEQHRLMRPIVSDQLIMNMSDFHSSEQWCAGFRCKVNNSREVLRSSKSEGESKEMEIKSKLGCAESIQRGPKGGVGKWKGSEQSEPHKSQIHPNM